MSKDKRLPNNERIAKYLDNEVPLQQLEHLPDIDLSSLELLDLDLESLPEVDVSELTDVLRGLEMNSHNDINNRLQAHSEPIQGNDSNHITFIHAQLAYAKSKHSKQTKQKKKAYKKSWFKKGGK